MGPYCELEKTTSREILEKAESKKIRDSLVDFVHRTEAENKAGWYIQRFRKLMTSWVSYNGSGMKLVVNMRERNKSPTLGQERVPTRDELSKILRMASPFGGVSMALMAFSWLRPESLGDFKGTDGIRLGDFTELKVSAQGLISAGLPFHGFQQVHPSGGGRRRVIDLRGRDPMTGLHLCF